MHQSQNRARKEVDFSEHPRMPADIMSSSKSRRTPPRTIIYISSATDAACIRVRRQPCVACGKLTPMLDERENTGVRDCGWAQSLHFIEILVSPIW